MAEHLRGDVLGQLWARLAPSAWMQHLGHAGDLRGGLGGAGGVLAGHQHVHVAAAAWQRAVTVFSVAPLRWRCRVRQ